MTKDELRSERVRLEQVLGAYKSGRVTHYDEDERGELKRDVTPERIKKTEERIEEIDLQLSEHWRA